MQEHKVGTRAEWLSARRELLEREKELTRISDELAEQRRSCYAPESDFIVAYNQLLDRAPKGRSDEVPTRRHDEYETAGVGAVT